MELQFLDGVEMAKDISSVPLVRQGQGVAATLRWVIFGAAVGRRPRMTENHRLALDLTHKAGSRPVEVAPYGESGPEVR